MLEEESCSRSAEYQVRHEHLNKNLGIDPNSSATHSSKKTWYEDTRSSMSRLGSKSHYSMFNSNNFSVHKRDSESKVSLSDKNKKYIGLQAIGNASLPFEENKNVLTRGPFSQKIREHDLPSLSSISRIPQGSESGVHDDDKHLNVPHFHSSVITLNTEGHSDNCPQKSVESRISLRQTRIDECISLQDQLLRTATEEGKTASALASALGEFCGRMNKAAENDQMDERGHEFESACSQKLLEKKILSENLLLTLKLAVLSMNRYNRLVRVAFEEANLRKKACIEAVEALKAKANTVRGVIEGEHEIEAQLMNEVHSREQDLIRKEQLEVTRLLKLAEGLNIPMQDEKQGKV